MVDGGMPKIRHGIFDNNDENDKDYPRFIGKE
jgi:hypothetical protein